MFKIRFITGVFLLAWLVSLPCAVNAQVSPELEKEYQKAYEEVNLLYKSTNSAEYEAAAKKLMDLCLKRDDEQMFYKAWSNLVSYTFRTNTKRALQISDEMRNYAKEHNGKYGCFISTYINSFMALRMRKVDLAEELSEQALDYKNRNLPDVNGAFIYWQLADIYITKKNKQKAIELLDRIKYEPDLKTSHHTFEWVYKCKAVYEIKPVDTALFMTYYAEFQKAVQKYKHYDDPEMMNDYRYAELTGDYKKMLQIARQRKTNIQRNFCISRAYEKMKRYKEALDTFKLYVKESDSLVNLESRMQAETSSLELEAARASNEAKTLRMEKDRLMFIWVLVAVVILFGFTVIFMWWRHRNARRLNKIRAAQELIQNELRIAHDIQMSMVPSRFPQREDLDMYASMTPAKEVGGDLYSYQLDGDKLYFTLGDVSGKGVPASLFMAQVIRLFHTLAKQHMMPAEICTHINDALSGEDNEQGMFVTLWLGMIDFTTGHLYFCNAGHNPPIIGSGNNQASFLPMESNAPIGLWPGLEYIGEEIDNVRGRLLFIYTDGLNEAENAQLEQFGDERLLETLRAMQCDSARQVIETLTAEVEKHRNGAEANDDLTMLCLKLGFSQADNSPS